RRGGLYVVYGALSGEATPFPLITGLNKALTMRGYTVFEVVGDRERFDHAKEYVTDGLESGDFKPTVERTFGFGEMVAAHRFMESNQQFGKIVVTVP
ncbi:MAG: zinc-binding dehydrogenase, partial [Sinobacteraceae bacterium]|nr:zinc-binding dehydrogenase [Nevskiaceae bacterium]